MSEMLQSSKESPKMKPDEILLKKQEDGNWKGFANVHGKDVEVRGIDPYTCLITVLTHD